MVQRGAASSLGREALEHRRESSRFPSPPPPASSSELVAFSLGLDLLPGLRLRRRRDERRRRQRLLQVRLGEDADVAPDGRRPALQRVRAEGAPSGGDADARRARRGGQGAGRRRGGGGCGRRQRRERFWSLQAVEGFDCAPPAASFGRRRCRCRPCRPRGPCLGGERRHCRRRGN